MCNLAHAQDERKTEVISFALYAGTFMIDREDFADTYDTKVCFTASGECDVPLKQRVSLAIGGSGIARSGTTNFLIYSASPYPHYTQVRKGNSNYQQLMFTLGPRYHISVGEDFRLLVDLSLAIGHMGETAYDENQKLVLDRNGTGFGYQVGASFERYVNNTPFSLSVAARYLVARATFDEGEVLLDGASILGGIRYIIN